VGMDVVGRLLLLLTCGASTEVDIQSCRGALPWSSL